MFEQVRVGTPRRIEQVAPVEPVSALGAARLGERAEVVLAEGAEDVFADRIPIRASVIGGCWQWARVRVPRFPRKAGMIGVRTPFSPLIRRRLPADAALSGRWGARRRARSERRSGGCNSNSGRTCRGKAILEGHTTEIAPSSRRRSASSGGTWGSPRDSVE